MPSFQLQRLKRLLYLQRKYTKNDASVITSFNESNPELRKFTELVDYFWSAFLHYLDPVGTRAYYPGFSSIYGADSDAIEGVTRTLPLWASFATSPLADDTEFADEMLPRVRACLLAGTDPSGSGYWGDVTDKSTLICEGADVALAVWLLRDTAWIEFDSTEKRQILNWLSQIPGKDTVNNNWHLFVILVDAVLCDLDPSHAFSSEHRVSLIESMYVGDGCFEDGPAGAVDLYNAWAFHYVIFWLSEIRPKLVGELREVTLKAYVNWYKFLFTPDGFPLYGRSLCYRLAVGSPMVAAAALELGVRKGVALQALWDSWRFFLNQGALYAGRPTQGVFRDNLVWLDPYSGPASAFWGTRSLVMLYFTSRTVDWRRANFEPLPISQADAEINLHSAGLKIQANRSSKVAVITVCETSRVESVVIKRQSTKQRIQELFYGHAFRPSNNLLELGVCEFDSRLSLYR